MMEKEKSRDREREREERERGREKQTKKSDWWICSLKISGLNFQDENSSTFFIIKIHLSGNEEIEKQRRRKGERRRRKGEERGKKKGV